MTEDEGTGPEPRSAEPSAEPVVEPESADPGGPDLGRGGASGNRWRAAHGRRPPWWPDDEPWPPHGGPWGGPWRGGPWKASRGRRRSPVARGFGCLFGLVFLVGLVGILGIVGSALAAIGPLGDVARVVGIGVLVAAAAGLVLTIRTLGRAASGLDDLSEAAARVEAGDFTVRVTERARGPYPVRELHRRFNAMAARLEADDEQRRRLLADVGHELRTPLAVVQGNLEAILDGVHPADEEHLAAILDETRVLSRLVDDLRTVTLSESGRLALHREPTDLAVLAAEVAASFRPGAAGAGVTIDLGVADDLPLLDVDPVRIREVLVNLVANALRHTPAGGTVGLEAAISRGAAMTDGGDVVVRVRDTGAGIEPALLPHVFERFTKGDDSRGSGLGLAIARGLVEAHGGTIEVASEAGRGSVFTVRLPISEPDRA